jgi:hypothetical protein
VQHPNASQVVTTAVDGSAPRWLGTLGHVTGLTYSFACPGGCDQLSCTLEVPARFRTDALNPGRIVQVVRGASIVWDGKLDEPTPGAGGWTVTAHGSGTFGTDFMARYTTDWATTMPDQAINDAIGRGLRWVNNGVNGTSGIFLGQRADSASMTITDLLNLCCTNGALTWYISCRPRGNVLKLMALPTVPNRILVSSTPVARTLGGDYNTIWLRYESDADKNVPAVYHDVSATEPASIAAHGPMEAFEDLSSVGVQTSGAATLVGTNILKRYQRASFAGPFTVSPGQLLTTGGTPVDLGCEQAGGVCRLMLTDYGYGGEISPAPVQFIVGGYSYDDDAQVATVTPFQAFRTDFAAMLGNAAAQGPTAADLRYAKRERHADALARQAARRHRRHERWRDRHKR